MLAFAILNSTILTGLSITKGGGGWRKTFKKYVIQFRIFLLKVSSISSYKFSVRLKSLRAFHKNKYRYGFNPDTKIAG
jgi:hypothetical protein